MAYSSDNKVYTFLPYRNFFSILIKFFVLSCKAIGQVLYLRPYVNDFSTEWVVSSVTLLTLGSVFTTFLGERISDLKLGNGTSLLIFTSIISYLPASFGRTVAQAFQEGNYIGLATIVLSFFLLVLGIVYVQVSELLHFVKLLRYFLFAKLSLHICPCKI